MNEIKLLTGNLPSQQHSPRRIILAGIAIIVFFVGGFLLWSFIAPLEAAVHAQGEIIFDTKRKTVQHLEGGIVKQILVREGDAVTAGQPLILLADDQVRPTVDLLESQSLTETAAIARLDAEKNEQLSIAFPPTLTSRANDPAVARIIQTETRLFQARRDAFTSQLAILKTQRQQLKEELTGLEERLVSKKREVALLTEQLAFNRELLKDGYVTRTVVMDIERFLAERTGERDTLIASMAGNRQRLAEIDSREISLKSTRIQDAVNEMKAATVKRLELEERVRPAQNALERQVIRAPIAGRIVDLRVTTVGGVISGKEPLMDIAPTSDHLILEAKIGVNDIHDVRTGQIAEVNLTAFKTSTTPPVEATVTQISADRLTTRTVQGEMPYYSVQLEIDQASLKRAGDLQLYPGMAAQVAITTKARTAFDYFIGPFTDRMGRAFHEK